MRTAKGSRFGFFTTRSRVFQPHRRLAPSLTEMEAELKGLQERLRNPRFGLANVVGVTLLRLPQIIPAVARVSASVLRRDAARHQPPTP